MLRCDGSRLVASAPPGQGREEGDDISGSEWSIVLGVLAVHQSDTRHRGRDAETTDQVAHRHAVRNLERGDSRRLAVRRIRGQGRKQLNLHRHPSNH